MTSYPRELAAHEISPELATLIRDLASRMLEGRAAAYQTLRDQLAAARVSRITLTGAGLYAYFEHPLDTTTVAPADLIGGEVPMEVRTLDAPAGSLLKVSGGRLDFVEIYTFGDRPWPDAPEVIAFGAATPLPIRVEAT